MDIEVLYGKESTPALASRPWVRDGVDELEVSVILSLRNLISYAESDGEALLRLPFLDAIEQADADTLDVLGVLAAGLPRLFHGVLEKPWLEDGLSEREVEVVEELQKLTGSSEEAALLILSLPFLDAVEDADAATVGVLGDLAGRWPELFDAAVKRPWVADGLVESEMTAIRSLEGLADNVVALKILEAVKANEPETISHLAGLSTSQHELFLAIVKKPWVGDGLDESETLLVNNLERLANGDEAAKVWIAMLMATEATAPFTESRLGRRYDSNHNGGIDHGEAVLAVTEYTEGELTEHELTQVLAQYAFSKALLPLPSLIELMSNTGWYSDGIDDDIFESELIAERSLREIGANSELASTISRWPWIFDEQLTSSEALVLDHLSAIDEQAPELTQLIVKYTWLADDIDRWESATISRFHELVSWNATGFAMKLASAPWVEDGVTLLEVVFGINTLREVAVSPDLGTSNPQVAEQIMDLIRHPPDFLDLTLVNMMTKLREHTAYNVQTDMVEHIPSGFDRLFSQPWFVDGLDRKERVYLIATIALGDRERLYAPHTIETKTIDLPMAGPVNLWVVGHHQFNSGNTLATMERAVRGSEEFWEIPFPVEDVILYVLEPGFRGAHIGFMMFLAASDGDVPHFSIFHEVAHYYLHEGPIWFAEGGANVVAHYVEAEGNLPSPSFPDHCSEQGLKNLQDWTELEGGDLWDVCSYSMGTHFLLSLRDVMGEDAWLSALKALYLEYEPEGALYLSVGLTDEDIYRVFIEHAPSDLEEEVNDVFRRLHGGPFISQPG